jgi:uncharacterized protein (DUF433 family)
MSHNPQVRRVRRGRALAEEEALDQSQIVGRGIYSFARAAEIVGVSPQSLRQWALGRRARPGSVSERPLVHLDIPDLDGERVLSFLNLVEVKLVGEFRRLGLPLQYIRRVVDVLEQSYDMTHPLVCQRLQTDGKSIFAEIDESGQFACIEIAGRRPNHVVFEDVIRPLFKEIDFSGSPLMARRWYPLGRIGGIVVDPEVAFGEPVLLSSGIPTRTLARQVSVAGDSMNEVAQWYEVPTDAVLTALNYESSLRAKAA